uniref:Uncharacterized protein n=1 Tax=Schizaphis graminum TaxID=13262 RepID=A0A2S2NRJ1_SCHGA
MPLIDISNFYNEMLFRNIARQEKSCKTNKSFSNRLINDATLDTELRQYFFHRHETSLKKKIKPQNYEYSLPTYIILYSLRVGLPPSKSLESRIDIDVNISTCILFETSPTTGTY